MCFCYANLPSLYVLLAQNAERECIVGRLYIYIYPSYVLSVKFWNEFRLNLRSVKGLHER